MWGLGYLGGMSLPFLSWGGALLALLAGIAGWGLMFLRRWWRPDRRWGVAAAVAAIGLLLMWRAPGIPRMADAKVIVLGLDGLSPTLLERYLQEGRLPNFQRLKDFGVYRHLATTSPALSPVAWASFATGMNPGRHGLFDFLRRDPATYLPDLALAAVEPPARRLTIGPWTIPLGRSRLASQRKGTAFWEVTSRAKIPTVVLRCPVTFPPDRVHGRMLSGLGVPDLRGTQGTFSFYTTAPQPAARDLGGLVMPVAWRDGVIETHVAGPRNLASDPPVDARVPLRIEAAGDAAIRLTIHGDTRTLAEGAWSDWWRIRFPIGPGINVSGIARFYLVSTRPALNVYLSPVQFDPLKPAFPISSPPAYAAELAHDLGLYHTLGQAEDTWGYNEGRVSGAVFLQQAYTVLAEREAMWRRELERFRGGLLVGVFDTPDRIQHMFWRTQDEGHPGYSAALAKEFAGVIPDLYQRMDAIVGHTLARLDDRTVLIVLSDHGFTTFRRVVHLNRWLQQHGWLTERVSAGEAADASLFQTVDWSRTRAYAVGLAGIYLNLKGRERAGVVEPAEAPAVADAIRRALLQARDPLDGAPLVRTVDLGAELYHGPQAAHGPDLVLGYADGYRASWQTALGGVPAEVVDHNRKAWSGDHCVDPQLVPGIFLCNRPIAEANPRIIDIAPTILSWLGLEPPEETDGQTLR